MQQAAVTPTTCYHALIGGTDAAFSKLPDDPKTLQFLLLRQEQMLRESEESLRQR